MSGFCSAMRADMSPMRVSARFFMRNRPHGFRERIAPTRHDARRSR
jgi:hypothetical protein